jgi:hypothetical protein
MTSPQTLRIRGLDDLPTLVPHLMGFHPTSSLVVLGLRGERSRIVITVRVDLPPPDAEPDDLRTGAAAGLHGLEQAGAEEVIALVYPRPQDDPWLDPDRPGPLPHEDLLGELADLLTGQGIRIRDIVCVGAQRQRSYLCTSHRCCPPEGRPLRDERSTLVDATMAAHGSAPLAGRESLAAQLAPRDERDPVLIAVRRASARAPMRLAPGMVERADRFVADLRRWDGAPRDTAARARLVATVAHLTGSIGERDLLLRGLTVEADHDLLKLARAVLAEAVRCAEAGHVARIAAVLAVCCWVDGDGAAAWVALDRALAADPDYSLARLVATALEQGQPPWIWTSVMARLTPEELLAAARPDPERSTA